ncbi:MAG: radical SAM protein [Candidatus Aminicenantes bacterium]|nr:MAG: radical SAM protein [Candidatus Aminicenantes bacterium]
MLKSCRQTTLPIIYLTNQCDLNCSYCLIKKRKETRYFLEIKEYQARIRKLLEKNNHIKSINMTGGEPTLHPELLKIVDITRKVGIDHIIINTNGIMLAKDRELLQALHDRDVTLALSINSIPFNSVQERLFEKLNDLKMPVAIITIASHQGEENLKKIYDYFIKSNIVVSLEIQPMVFTGENVPAKNDYEKIKKEKITLDMIKEKIELISNGKISTGSYFSPGNSHESCYQSNYLLKINESTFVPFMDFVDRKKFENLFKDNLFVITLDKAEQLFKDTLYELWSKEDSKPKENILEIFKKLLEELFPREKIPGREQIKKLPEYVKSIGIHSYMDCFTFSEERLRTCGRHILLHQGKKVPVCYFNHVLNPTAGVTF